MDLQIIKVMTRQVHKKFGPEQQLPYKQAHYGSGVILGVPPIREPNPDSQHDRHIIQTRTNTELCTHYGAGQNDLANGNQAISYE